MARKAKQDDLRHDGKEFSKYDEQAQRFVPTSEREAEAIRQRFVRRSNRGNADQASWNAVSDESIASLVRSVTRLGFAVQFGYTRDGGALSLRFVGDGEPYTEYIRPTEDVDATIDGIISDYASAPDNEFAAKRSS